MLNKLEFSADLNSYERALIHEISDEIGLKHESVGVGKQRYILVQKSNNTDVSDLKQTRKVSFNDNGWLVVQEEQPQDIPSPTPHL